MEGSPGRRPCDSPVSYTHLDVYKRQIEARVIKVRDDGKLDLSPRDKSYVQINTDSDLIMDRLEEYKGILPFNDRVSSDIIKNEFNLSKNAFKRAVGHLLKEGKVKITEKTIEKV